MSLKNKGVFNLESVYSEGILPGERLLRERLLRERLLRERLLIEHLLREHLLKESWSRAEELKSHP